MLHTKINDSRNRFNSTQLHPNVNMIEYLSLSGLQSKKRKKSEEMQNLSADWHTSSPSWGLPPWFAWSMARLTMWPSREGMLASLVAWDAISLPLTWYPIPVAQFFLIIDLCFIFTSLPSLIFLLSLYLFFLIYFIFFFALLFRTVLCLLRFLFVSIQISVSYLFVSKVSSRI